MKFPRTCALPLMFFLALLARTEPAYAGAVQCSASTSEVSFGTYIEIDGNVRDTISRLRITCTGAKGTEVKYTISLTGSSGPGVVRTMNRGKNALVYNLYMDRTRRRIWGDGRNGTATVSDSMVLDSTSSCFRDYTIYGRISSARTGGPVEYAEAYADTIYVLVSY